VSVLSRDPDCSSVLGSQLREEIQTYSADVQRIIDLVTVKEKGETLRQLAEFVDAFGPRFTATPRLEAAIDDRVARFKQILGDDAVHTEDVSVPKWIRGRENAVLLGAWKGGANKTLEILSLGYSVGTGENGITAEAIVVKSFDELKALSDNQVKGKIVVYNQDWVDYGTSVQYRSAGASEAAKKGALAALIRSVTGFSLYTPHTGMMNYQDAVPKIPAISITVEDAELMWRKYKRGETLRVHLYAEARTEGTAISRNSVAELRGGSAPEEVVLVGGHIDSWDVGQGAMDDGGGAAISWRVPEVLTKLNLKPRRTVRSVLFTAEEMGLLGGQAYFKAHQEQKDSMQYVMESDFGTFTPLGLTTAVKNEKARCILLEALKLLQPINATQLEYNSDGPDIGQWFALGVPGGSLLNRNPTYFHYHHTNADTIHLMSADDLDRATAVWTAMAYVFAQLSQRIPHDVAYALPTGTH